MRFSVRLLLAVVAVALVCCDHETKFMAVDQLKDQAAVQVWPGVMSLRYTENHDTAFSMLRWVDSETRQPLLQVWGGVAILSLLVVWFVRRRSPWIEQVGYCIVMGGALGNYTSRLLDGHVVDFIHVRNWPVFNVADILITVGLVFVMVGQWRSDPKPPDPPGKAPPDLPPDLPPEPCSG